MSPITRQQYLGELRHYLSFMEPQDLDAVLQEYTARLDAAEDEAALLAQLDTPMRVAIQLRTSYAPVPAPPAREKAGEAEEAPAAEEAAPEDAETEKARAEEQAAQAEEDADLERAVGAAVAAILAEHGLSPSHDAGSTPAASGDAPAPAEEAAPESPSASQDLPEEPGAQEEAAEPAETDPARAEDAPPEDAVLSAPEEEAGAQMGFPMEAEFIYMDEPDAAGESEETPAQEETEEAAEPELQTQELHSEDAPQDEAASGRVLPQEGDSPARKRPGAFAGQVVLCVLGGLLLALAGCAVAFVGLFVLDVGLRSQSTMVSDALLLYAVACLLFAGALPILAAAVRLPARRISRKRRELLLGEKDAENKPWPVYWRVIIILLCLLGVGVVALTVAAMFTGCRIPRAADNVRTMVERIDWAYYQAWFSGLFR